MKHLILSILLITASAPVFAAKPQLLIQQDLTLNQLLKGQADKRVGLILQNGQELSGILKEVGDQVVRLHQLSGREYFDAVIRLDQVTAVVIRNN